MKKQLMQKIERKKVDHDVEEIVDLRSFKWDGGDKTLGKNVIVALPTITKKKVKHDGFLVRHDLPELPVFLDKGDYIIVEFYKNNKRDKKIHTYVNSVSAKTYKKYYKEIEN